MQITAEGVEDAEQAAILKSKLHENDSFPRVDDIQGYYYARPVPQDVFEKLLPAQSLQWWEQRQEKRFFPTGFARIMWQKARAGNHWPGNCMTQFYGRTANPFGAFIFLPNSRPLIWGRFFFRCDFFRCLCHFLFLRRRVYILNFC